MDIEKAIRNEHRHAWVQSLKKSPLAIAIVLLILIVLVWYIYKSGDKPIQQEKILGELVGLHQVQSKFRSTIKMLSIKIPDQGIVTVTAPAGMIFKHNKKVELVKVITEQGSVHYYFSRYSTN